MTLLGEEKMAEAQQAAAELGATLPGAEVTDVFPLAHELIDLLLRGLRRSAGAGRGSGNRLRRLVRRSASIWPWRGANCSILDTQCRQEGSSVTSCHEYHEAALSDERPMIPVAIQMFNYKTSCNQRGCQFCMGAKA